MVAKQTVRLQIHVDAELAERIDAVAKRMNRKTAWMVAELLIQAVTERERLLDWMSWRVVKLLGCADPRNLLAKFSKAEARPFQKGTVYLQTNVSLEVAESLQRLANANQRTRADMSTLLLNWVMDDEEWIIQAVTTRWFAAMYDGMGLPRGQQDEHNGEANDARQPREEERSAIAVVPAAA